MMDNVTIRQVCTDVSAPNWSIVYLPTGGKSLTDHGEV